MNMAGERASALDRRINDSEIWRSYLTETQYAVFRRMARHEDTFRGVLYGPEPEEAMRHFVSAEEGISIALQDDFDPLSMVFRCRCMISDEELLGNGQDELTAPSAVPEAVTRKVDEDNYDDEDSEGDAEDSRGDDKAVLDKAKPGEGTGSTLEMTAAQELQHAMSSLAVYHTLEYDRDAIMEQNTLDLADQQDSLDTSNAVFNQSMFGAANLSLKYLLGAIAAKRDSLSLTNQELKLLLQDVRKNRSKWTSDERVGQEELYEAAEKVVLELRAYTEHSTPFLSRVSKREAPDYYTVIKHPMDLGTVMKKLKALEYRSKQEFVDDLNLIWSNCLAYNTDPNHFIRRHALAMQKKTNTLVQLVPNIVVRDRAEVEREELEKEANDSDIDSVSAPGDHHKRSSKTTTKQRPNKAHRLGVDRLDTASPTPVTAGSENGEAAIDHDDEEGKGSSAAADGVEEHQIKDSCMDGEEAQELARRPANEMEDSEGDPDFHFWRQLTKKARTILAQKRGRMFQGFKLAPDSEALVRERLAMTEFAEKEKLSLETNSAQWHTERGGMMTLDRAQLLNVIDYDPVSGFPDVVSSVAKDDVAATHITANNCLEQTSQNMVYSFNKPLLRQMVGSCQRMQKIRRTCQKIATVRQMQQGVTPIIRNTGNNLDSAASATSDAWSVEMTDFAEPRATFQSTYDTRLPRELLKKSCAILLFHAGFEVFQEMSLDVVVDTMIEYITNVGRAFRVFFESGMKETAVTSLLKSLSINGVSSINTLPRYVDEMARHDSRLEDVQVRLQRFLGDMLRPAVSGLSAESRIFGEQGEDSMMSGDFTDEIGEDFFGFRELGLEKEFGLSSLSVPLSVLQGRLRATVADEEVLEDDLALRHKPPPPFAPVTRSNAKLQIGLIKPFLEARLESLGTDELAEDEPRSKLRVPPTGKIPPSTKRRHAAGSGAGPTNDSTPSRKRKKVEEGGDKNSVRESNGPPSIDIRA